MKSIVLIQCPTCPTWLSCEFDPGETQTYEHPGQPAMWFSVNDPGIQHDTQGFPWQCDHDGGLNRADWETFQARCERIDAESFEDGSLESQYRLEYDDYAKYMEQEYTYKPCSRCGDDPNWCVCTTGWSPTGE